MLRLSQDMTQGRIVQWLKREGDSVEEGEAVVSVETDKTEVEIQAPQSGILRKILVGAGEDADVGTPLAILGEAEEDIRELLETAGKRPPKPVSAVPTVPSGERGAPALPVPAVERQPISPLARRVAKELGVDLSRVTGSGAGGLVTLEDVRASAVTGKATPVRETMEGMEVIPLTGLRRRIAERLSLSRRTAADVTTVTDVDMSDVVSARNASGFSYTAYVTWAVGQALREFPILNSSLVDDRILVKKDIHIGVAVALEQGLVAPLIRFADRKSVAEISREIDELAARARDGQLAPDELTAGTFTVTNSGGFGSLLFTPIINYPEVAILGMGKVADTPVVRGSEIVVRKVMYLCLSYDHRVVDGAPAVQFLQAVKRVLEDGAIDFE
jgi:pyruvate/2-oxoglutarate dehydrogenase complex dihydrolipoamide acyltransferase (E2) component